MEKGLFERLDARMSEISEQASCAGWQVDLEFRLWEVIRGACRQLGQIVLSEAEVADLRLLASRLGGWIAFRHGRVFVPSARWEQAFAVYQRGEPTRSILDSLERDCEAVPYPD